MIVFAALVSVVLTILLHIVIFPEYIADQILRFLQQRCDHPDKMVSADIFEGSCDAELSYCNRCGAIRRKSTFDRSWRRPDPNLWRGK